MTVERGEGWTLYLGDCLTVMPALEPVDHVITDPPYDDHVHNKSRRGATKEAHLPLSSGGKFYRCSFSRSADLGFAAITPKQMTECAAHFASLPRRWVLVFSNVELAKDWQTRMIEAGLQYVRTGAWIKEACTPQFTGDRPGAGFEAISICHPKGRKRWNGGGKQGIWSHRVAGNQPGSTTPRVHTTQKPDDLMMALVEDFTDPGETILDPFAGSGTTGVAALRLGRRFIGIEKDPKYFALACERLRAEERGQSLTAYRSGQETLFGKDGTNG